METISFNNDTFKIKELELPEFGNVLISTADLNKLLFNSSGSYVSREAEIIDDQIFYYVERKEIDLSNKKLKDILLNEIK